MWRHMTPHDFFLVLSTFTVKERTEKLLCVSPYYATNQAASKSVQYRSRYLFLEQMFLIIILYTQLPKCMRYMSVFNCTVIMSLVGKGCSSLFTGRRFWVWFPRLFCNAVCTFSLCRHVFLLATSPRHHCSSGSIVATWDKGVLAILIFVLFCFVLLP